MDIAKVAVIGPHADSTVVGFPAYTYPAGLQMLLGRIGGGETSMAGADASDASLPREAKAAMEAEFQDLLSVSLTVTNTGIRRRTEVVQLYAADTATGVTLPAQQLIGFARLDRDALRRDADRKVLRVREGGRT